MLSTITECLNFHQTDWKRKHEHFWQCYWPRLVHQGHSGPSGCCWSYSCGAAIVAPAAAIAVVQKESSLKKSSEDHLQVCEAQIIIIKDNVKTRCCSSKMKMKINARSCCLEIRLPLWRVITEGSRGEEVPTQKQTKILSLTLLFPQLSTAVSVWDY